MQRGEKHSGVVRSCLFQFPFLHVAFINYTRQVIFRLIIGIQISTLLEKFASKELCNSAKEKVTGFQASL